jgi:hypothetical protein
MMFELMELQIDLRKSAEDYDKLQQDQEFSRILEHIDDWSERFLRHINQVDADKWRQSQSRKRKAS